MTRHHPRRPAPEDSEIDAALEALGAEELRGLIRDLISDLDGSAAVRLIDAVVDAAARNRSDWVPAGPDEKTVARILKFAQAARRAGYAEAWEVDNHLREGSEAFLSRNYAAAQKIFQALLIPIAEVEIDLGQDEMVDEVLDVEISDCAAQYAVSVYMTTAPGDRAKAVLAAVIDVRDVGYFFEPLRNLERVAVEPLPDFQDFLRQWRALLEERVAGQKRGGWSLGEDDWLREVAGRLEGTAGLARLARSTKKSEDLRAWCNALVEAKDWDAALAACEEAAGFVTDGAHVRAEFLDRAALAAQELGRGDLPKHLERAWREAPSMVRLRRWLGSFGPRDVLPRRAAAALDACPRDHLRQRSLLHLLLGEHEAAADLLAGAPGLGWSRAEHPGHFLFPLLCRQLGGPAMPMDRAADIDALSSLYDRTQPRLYTPSVEALLELAGTAAPEDAGARAAVLRAMRQAAEKRIAGLTAGKHRGHYGHAARLVAACVALDRSIETTNWVADIRTQYRRFWALRREIDEQLERR